MTPTMATPLLFKPDMEHLEDDEAATDASLDDTMRGIRETTFEHSGHANRSVHAKSHGVLKGTLTVVDNLPPVLAQGLFAKAGSYETILRFSTLPGDILNDSVSTPRGVALKVIGVEGARLPGSEGDVTQDFVMARQPRAHERHPFPKSIGRWCWRRERASNFRSVLRPPPCSSARRPLRLDLPARRFAPPN